MELKDFIKTSITEICFAIEEANKELADSEAIVNPGSIQVNSEESQAYGRQSTKAVHEERKLVQKIDFDIAVQAQEGEKAGGGAKISIASIGIGASAETTSQSKSESRLKFSIPIIYPQGKA
ncbi:hypothetical protein [Shewanella psychrophila]|nr:hypothetical protein [Shewanella psychrophila]